MCGLITFVEVFTYRGATPRSFNWWHSFKISVSWITQNSSSLHVLESSTDCYLYLTPFFGLYTLKFGRVKRICVFEHSVMTNFNCACSAIQRGQGSGFLSKGSSWLSACMSEQRRFWRNCADAQARLNHRCSHRR